MARPDFDPSDAVDFWDLTNRQDWEVCELAADGHGPGAYAGALLADGGHGPRVRPDVADRYAADGVMTRFAPRHDKWANSRRGSSGLTVG